MNLIRFQFQKVQLKATMVEFIKQANEISIPGGAIKGLVMISIALKISRFQFQKVQLKAVLCVRNY